MESKRFSLRIGFATALVAGLSGCPLPGLGFGNGSQQKTQPDCPLGTRQCGYGCLVNSCRCCNSATYSSDWDEGTFECPGALIATCQPNTGGHCTAAVSGTGEARTASKFCCSTDSDVGTKDCKNGLVACNQNCVPVGSVCCSAQDQTNCGTVGGAAEPDDSGGGIAGTWTGTYSMTSDFSYQCPNVTTLSYNGSVTWTLTEDLIGMVSGTVSMTGVLAQDVQSGPTTQCSTVTLSPSAPVVKDGGYVAGASVQVNVEFGFGSAWGTNQLLFFSGTLSGSTISGTITGMTSGGTGGTTGTFSVTRH